MKAKKPRPRAADIQAVFPQLPYTVGYIRSQGIECRWSRNRNGAPIILGKTDCEGLDGKPIWAYINHDMWKRAAEVGLKQAFEEHTALIGILNVRA